MENSESNPLLSQSKTDANSYWLADPEGLHGSFALKIGADYKLVETGGSWTGSLADQVSDPEALLLSAAAEILKVDRRRIVAKIRVADQDLIFKIYHDDHWLRRLVNWLRGSKAMQVAKGTRIMSAAGFRAPELVAILESANRTRSCVISALVPGPTLEELWRGSTAPVRRQIGRDFARYLRQVHDLGVYPQDIKSSNFIALENDGRWQFYLVDLDAVKKFKRVSKFRVQKNLIQVERSIGREASKTQRLLLLKSYFGALDSRQLRVEVGRLLQAARIKEHRVQSNNLRQARNEDE